MGNTHLTLSNVALYRFLPSHRFTRQTVSTFTFTVVSLSPNTFLLFTPFIDREQYHIKYMYIKLYRSVLKPRRVGRWIK